MILVIVIVLTPALVYLGMSYTSVEGTTMKLVGASRGGSPGFVNMFNVTVLVYSSAASLNMRINNPTFLLSVDSYPFGTVSAGPGNWKPYGSFSYNLQFRSTDYAAGNSLARSTANNLVITMSGTVSAGIFSDTVVRSDTATQTF